MALLTELASVKELGFVMGGSRVVKMDVPKGLLLEVTMESLMVVVLETYLDSTILKVPRSASTSDVCLETKTVLKWGWLLAQKIMKVIHSAAKKVSCLKLMKEVKWVYCLDIMKVLLWLEKEMVLLSE